MNSKLNYEQAVMANDYAEAAEPVVREMLRILPQHNIVASVEIICGSVNVALNSMRKALQQGIYTKGQIAAFDAVVLNSIAAIGSTYIEMKEEN